MQVDAQRMYISCQISVVIPKKLFPVVSLNLLKPKKNCLIMLKKLQKYGILSFPPKIIFAHVIHNNSNKFVKRHCTLAKVGKRSYISELFFHHIFVYLWMNIQQGTYRCLKSEPPVHFFIYIFFYLPLSQKKLTFTIYFHFMAPNNIKLHFIFFTSLLALIYHFMSLCLYVTVSQLLEENLMIKDIWVSLRSEI